MKITFKLSLLIPFFVLAQSACADEPIYGERIQAHYLGSLTTNQMNTKANRSKVSEPSIRAAAMPYNVLTASTAIKDSVEDNPDVIAAIGTEQIIMTIKPRMRSFNKHTGQPDQILNISWHESNLAANNLPLMTDPVIKFDRFAKVWYIFGLPVGLVQTLRPQKLSSQLTFAVSDSDIITKETVWRFFALNVAEIAPAGGFGKFPDYPQPGITQDAILIAYEPTGPPEVETGIVIQKSSLLNSNSPVVNIFRTVLLPTRFMFTGIDNFDANGRAYFGVFSFNALSPNVLTLREILNPGSATPSLGVLTAIPLPFSSQGNWTVPHQGGLTPLQGGGFFTYTGQAHIRNNIMYLLSTTGLNAANGVTPGPITHSGLDITLIDVSGPTPTFMQATRLIDPNKPIRYYWFPSLMTNSNGEMAISGCTAATNEFINAWYLRFPINNIPTQLSPTLYTNSTTSYNPFPPSNRWSDYSATLVDPVDDITMYALQQYCSNTNEWGIRLATIQ